MAKRVEHAACGAAADPPDATCDDARDDTVCDIALCDAIAALAARC